MHCILDARDEVRERRDQVRRSAYVKPERLAAEPIQVCSLDIAKLMGPRKWSYFHLYVMIDVFCRNLVGWMVAERESAELAKGLIEVTIHADRGSSMKSKQVTLLLANLGVIKTHADRTPSTPAIKSG